MSNWYFVPDYLPADGQQCWVRLYNGYANPFSAIYSSSAQTWTMTTNGAVFPLWMVAKWKVFTSPLDSFTKLLLPMNGPDGSSTFIDLCGNPVASSGAVQSGAQSKFFSTSGSFNGSAFLSIPNKIDFDFGSGDWSVCLWVYGDSFPGNQVICGLGDAALSPSGWLFCIGDYWTGSVILYIQIMSGNEYQSSAISLNPSDWNFLTIVRHGNNLLFFCNGILTDTIDVTGQSFDINSAGLTIGCVFAGGGQYNFYSGFMQELRLSKGIARWTSNFTPPVSPY